MVKPPHSFSTIDYLFSFLYPSTFRLLQFCIWAYFLYIYIFCNYFSYFSFSLYHRCTCCAVAPDISMFDLAPIPRRCPLTPGTGVLQMCVERERERGLESENVLQRERYLFQLHGFSCEGTVNLYTYCEGLISDRCPTRLQRHGVVLQGRYYRGSSAPTWDLSLPLPRCGQLRGNQELFLRRGE